MSIHVLNTTAVLLDFRTSFEVVHGRLRPALDANPPEIFEYSPVPRNKRFTRDRRKVTIFRCRHLQSPQG